MGGDEGKKNKERNIGSGWVRKTGEGDEDAGAVTVCFIFNKREMEMRRESRRALSGCIIINGDRCIFHGLPRAFTAHSEPNEWTYAADSDSGTHNYSPQDRATRRAAPRAM